MAKSVKRIFNAAAEGRSLESTKGLKVIEYRDAGPVLRAQMDAAMAPLDAAPGDAAPIKAYGGGVVEEVVALYKKIDLMSQPALREKAAELLPEIMELVHEMNGHLGTCKEVLRRNREVHAPAAADPAQLKEINQRRSDFIDRITILESARALGYVTAKRLESSVEQKDMLNVIGGTEFGEEHLVARKSSSVRKPKP